MTNRKHLVLPLNWKYRIFNVPKAEQNFPVLRALYSWAGPFQSVNSSCSTWVSRCFLRSKVDMNFSKKPKLAISILCSPATSNCPLTSQAVNTAVGLCVSGFIWSQLPSEQKPQPAGNPNSLPSTPGQLQESPSLWLWSAAASQLWCWQLSPRENRNGLLDTRELLHWGLWQRYLPKWCKNRPEIQHSGAASYYSQVFLQRKTEAGIARQEGCSRVLCHPLFSIQLLWMCLFLYKGQSSHMVAAPGSPALSSCRHSTSGSWLQFD